jgi:hypothetical protein
VHLFSVVIMHACRVLRVFASSSDMLPHMVVDLRTAHVRTNYSHLFHCLTIHFSFPSVGRAVGCWGVH